MCLPSSSSRTSAAGLCLIVRCAFSLIPPVSQAPFRQFRSRRRVEDASDPSKTEIAQAVVEAEGIGGILCGRQQRAVSFCDSTATSTENEGVGKAFAGHAAERLERRHQRRAAELSAAELEPARAAVAADRGLSALQHHATSATSPCPIPTSTSTSTHSKVAPTPTGPSRNAVRAAISYPASA